MDCPLCKVNLHMTDRQGIEIDYCPQCRGIWLDRGELEKLIELSSASSAVASLPHRNDDRRGSGRHLGDSNYQGKGRKKKESWLSVLLDFD